MKFGKSLSIQIEETLPEWRDKFLSYKELKKRLKLIEPKGSSASAGDGGAVARPNKRPKLAAAGNSNGGGEKEAMTEAEVDFVKLLEDELEKFNSFFVEKEEEYIIRLKVRNRALFSIPCNFILKFHRLPVTLLFGNLDYLRLEFHSNSVKICENKKFTILELALCDCEVIDIALICYYTVPVR